MNDKQQQDLCEALEASPDLLPFMPELLADMWVLGSSPEIIVDFLRPLGLLLGETRVLDLGCGKGAVAITIARELGFRVHGVDLMAPFIDEANRRAIEQNVADLCHFEVADLHDEIKKAGEFDVLIYASVGGLLGTPRECIAQLRQVVRSGGYIIIDDGFLTGTVPIERQGYENYVSHEETLRQLTSHGDTLLRETIIPSEEVRAQNRKYFELIRSRADRLMKQKPEAAPVISAYLARQEEECEIIETAVKVAVWLLQKK
jgi:cyclopropane fatty-acyl-phospholipid synthase-like methyltransferase